MAKNGLKFALFLGCVIPNRYPMIERATKNVFEKFKIELVDMEGASCCPAPGVYYYICHGHTPRTSFEARVTCAAEPEFLI
ncbi:unnamed protein product [marine sediment metagenome]|uniref:Cysteine-rich domain-containing protein n=1 Tax=marine sediment metagenome TaxID=412755 RepID=X1DBZ5_9ZZZZ